MANEVTVVAGLVVTKGGIPLVTMGGRSKVLDMAGNNTIQTTQDIGTAAELLTFGDISGTPKVLLLQNLDPTNFVEIGGDSGLTVFKFKLTPGVPVIFMPTSATIYAKADTAAVRLLKASCEA